MDKIRVGVIGVGYLGKFHAAKYAAMDDVTLVGVADSDQETADRVGRECGTASFGDYQQLLDKVTAVSVAVPTTLHHEVGMACLAKGVDVLMEKPITTTLLEADELISRAAERKVVLQVGHLERFNPAVLAMQKFLTYPMFIESHRMHIFKSRGADVDVVLDLMIHDIDIVLSIVSSEIKTIHTVGVPVVTSMTDIANARLIFENGCTANITVSRISKDNIRRLRIWQPRSYISVDYAKKEIMVIKLAGQTGKNELPKEEVSKSCFVEDDALKTELTDFIQNVRNRTIPKVSGREGRLALSIAQEIMSQITENTAHYKKILELDISSS